MPMNFVFNALHTSNKHAITDHLVRTSAKVALIAKCFGRGIGGYESVIAYWSVSFCGFLKAIYVHNSDSQRPI